MSKIGVNFKINVSKIDKSKLFHGKDGAVYLDATVYIDLVNEGQYGDSGMITQAKKKGDTENSAILGNVKIFWREDGNLTQNPGQQAIKPKPAFDATAFDNDDDIPF